MNISRKIIRKLIMAVTSLVFLVITFTASTYAWFKINSNAEINGFDFQVTGGEGFLISIDGENYSNDLSTKQIKQAIALTLDPAGYRLEKGELISNLNDKPVDPDVVIKKVSLLPLTSTDGIKLSDLYKSESTIDSGRYLEFSIYFKTASDSDDKIQYNIYLLDEEKTLEDGTKVEPCSISSVKTVVELGSDMNTIFGDYGLSYPNKTIDVYSSNALRMSIQDTSLDTPQATIFELSDNREFDLGSYATDYDKGTYVATRPADYDGKTAEEKAIIDAKIAEYNALDSTAKDELDRLYNCKTNAMYTYYNNLRPSSKLDDKLLSYDEKPTTFRSLEDAPMITNVQTGKGAKKITFRFWLEGWDADCFDGLANSIKVKLAFTSTKEIVVDDPTSSS